MRVFLFFSALLSYVSLCAAAQAPRASRKHVSARRGQVNRQNRAPRRPQPTRVARTKQTVSLTQSGRIVQVKRQAEAARTFHIEQQRSAHRRAQAFRSGGARPASQPRQTGPAPCPSPPSQCIEGPPWPSPGNLGRALCCETTAPVPDQNCGPHQSYPGLAVCPAVRVRSFAQSYGQLIGFCEVPRDYWFLDAPAFMERIAAQHSISRWAINLGAKPQYYDNRMETDGKVVQAGDDVTLLFAEGFSGLNFDLSTNKAKVEAFYDQWAPKAKVAFDVFPPAVSNVLTSNAVPKDVDFLKIDVDSFECEFLEEIIGAGYRPKVISMEVNAVMVPPIRYKLKYVGNNVTYEDLVGNMIGSCSLQYAHDFLESRGYSLVQFPIQDGWWVRNEYVHLFGKARTPEEAFRHGNPYFYGRYPIAMKRAVGKSNCLGEIKFLLHQALSEARLLDKAEYVLEYRT